MAELANRGDLRRGARRVGILLATIVAVEIVASFVFVIVDAALTSVQMGVSPFELYTLSLPFFAYGFKYIWIIELVTDPGYFSYPWGVESVLVSYVIAAAAVLAGRRNARARWSGGDR